MATSKLKTFKTKDIARNIQITVRNRLSQELKNAEKCKKDEKRQKLQENTKVRKKSQETQNNAKKCQECQKSPKMPRMPKKLTKMLWKNLVKAKAYGQLHKAEQS